MDDTATDHTAAQPLASDAGLKGFTLPGLSHVEKGRGPAPVDKWHPPYCGAIDMRIALDGTWLYQGSAIQRPALVKLFASILRKDADGYVLVTPVECVGIAVDDVPFLAVEMTRDAAGLLRLRTNVDDVVTVDAAHPLRFETDTDGGLKPYVQVRGGLWARLTRALVHDLVAIAEERSHEGEDTLGVVSGDSFFPLASLRDLAADVSGGGEAGDRQESVRP